MIVEIVRRPVEEDFWSGMDDRSLGISLISFTLHSINISAYFIWGLIIHLHIYKTIVFIENQIYYGQN